MLVADERHDFTRTHFADLAAIDFAQLVSVYEEMRVQAQASLRHKRGAEEQLQLDLRYVGQEFTLPVPVTLKQLKAGDRKGIRKAFDALYEHRYSHHSPDEPVEMVNMRLGIVGKRAKLKFPRLGQGGKAPVARHRDVYFSDAKKPVRCPVYERAELKAGARIAGPALIQEHGTTTVLFKGDDLSVVASGELIIKIGGA
jgi:N-methylhydantoinase A